jgi:hypothetical protein
LHARSKEAFSTKSFIGLFGCLGSNLSRGLVLDLLVPEDRRFHGAGVLFGGRRMTSFKGAKVPKDVILFAVHVYAR